MGQDFSNLFLVSVQQRREKHEIVSRHFVAIRVFSFLLVLTSAYSNSLT